MKVLLVAKQFGHFRHIEAVAESLLVAGHQIEWRFGDSEKTDITDRSVYAFNLKYHLGDYQKIPHPHGVFYSLSRFLQAFLGYRVYLKPGWTSQRYKINYLHRMHKVARALLTLPNAEKIISTQWFFSVVRGTMRFIPSATKVLMDLWASSPHVVMVTTNLPWNAHEMEYLKAAALLGIPAVVQVASWDNLTTKSTFNIIPDKVLLWNQSIKEEAEILHGVPTEKIVVTGAATFDYIFSYKPTRTHMELGRLVGLKTEEPYIVYLGSSTSIAGDESLFIREFARCVFERLKIRVLIRPHPVNYRVWATFNEPECVVWPKKGELPDTADTKQDFLDTLYHSVAVVGVNTSAMIEAAIMDKPCISIKADQFASSQSEVTHFRHLVNGQFLDIVENIDEAVSSIGRILDGHDKLKESRKAFVASFIRPNGLEKNVGTLIASTLLSVSH